MKIVVDKADLEKKFNSALHEIGLNLSQTFAEAAPVRTGFLKNSFSYELDGNVITIKAAEYLDNVLYGTPPHIITPKNKKALSFRMDGKKVLAKKVNHPGTAPNPFVFEVVDREYKKIMEDALRRNFR